MASKQHLIDFLEKRVFHPILSASPDKYSENDRKKLENVKKSTRSEIDRFRNYKDAAAVLLNYKRDLHSDAAKKVNRELDALRLPTLPSVEEEFLREAGER